MTLRRRILDYSLAGILLILPLVLLRSHMKEPDRLSGFDKAVLTISSPLQAAVSWVVEGVAGLFRGYVILVDVEEENDELRAENDRLRAELAAARRELADQKQLEDLILLRRRAEAETVGARVIAASINPYLRVVRLRLDRGDGEVAVGMPVVNGKGLVGVVQRVYGGHADVQLITDPKAEEVEVIAPKSGAVGSLAGLARDDAYRCKLRVEKRSGKVAVGDLIVTKNLGAFPGGIAVGTVSALSDVSYTLYQEVEVSPSVDFGSLGRVLVVVAPPPPPDPSGSEVEASSPAHKVGAF
ncbi:MAG TPA: rod shape-determining protein MreC [Kofleriaceae bacterium]|nr:rod shape-determining protein MreC [Kofleriaceae bacterium]